MHPQSVCAALAALLVVAACGSDEPSTPTPTAPPPPTVTAVTTTATGTPGWLLDDSLAVRVTNAQGQPVAGAKVAWHATVEGAIVRPDTATTDANGIARAEYSPGWNLGPQPVTARVGEAAATVTVTATGMRLTTVTHAMQRVCGLDQNGRLWCWTRTDNGTRPSALTVAQRPLPSPTAARFTRLHGVQLGNVGLRPLCGVTTTNELLCATLWDLDGSVAPLSQSVAVPVSPYPSGGIETPPPFPVKDVAIHQRGGSTICAIDTSDALWCIGRNSDGQFGDGSTQGGATWTATAPGMRWRQLSTSDNRSVCGVTLEGQAYCWSVGTGPILGESDVVVYTTPQPMPYQLPPLRAISHANNVLCGITVQDDRLLCWGDWSLVDPAPPRAPSPVPGLPTTATSLGGDGYTVHAVSGGRLYRFGYQASGADRALPGLSGVIRLLTSYGGYWCVEHQGGAVLCGAGTGRPVAVPLPATP